jgi:CubicO group peptidase (beta-lactamase class C family)
MKQAELKRALEYIDSWVTFRFDKLEIPGLSIAIKQKGKLIYTKSLGFANIENSVPLTPDHIFRIASHSKMFTAVAILQLCEAQKLSLDDHVSQYVPWLNEHNDSRWQSVTIRQLLSHSAGVIRDGLDSDFWALKRQFPDKSEFKKELLAAKLVLDPNTDFKYSNYGLALLGLVVAQASGKSFNQYAAEKIITPLRLTNTGPEYNNSLNTKIVTGYSRQDFTQRQRHAIPHIDTKSLSPATGFYSTPGDITTFATALMIGSNELLSDASKREMQRIQWSHEFAGKTQSYGLGLEYEEVGDWKLLGHGGGFPGHITDLEFHTDSGFAVSAMTNCLEGAASQWSKSIMQILHWFSKHASETPDNNLTSFSGRFYSLWNIVDIVHCGNTTIATEPNRWMPLSEGSEELEYINATSLLIKKASAFSSAGEIIKFNFDKNGQAKNIHYAGSLMTDEPTYLQSVLKDFETFSK